MIFAQKCNKISKHIAIMIEIIEWYYCNTFFWKFTLIYKINKKLQIVIFT